MAEYRLCRTCGNSEKGTAIYKCTACGYIGCYKYGGLLSSNTGCFTSSRCPNCDRLNTGQQLGRIE